MSLDLESGDVVWVVKPWIFPSLIEETVMVLVVFLASLYVEVYFGTAHFTILGIPFITLTGVVLLSIWSINAFHLLLFRSLIQYTLRKNSVEIILGILNKRSIIVSSSSYSGLIVKQSIVGKILNSGDVIVWSRNVKGEHRLGRVRNPAVLAEDIKKALV